MQFDATLHLGDLVLFILTAIIVPVLRTLGSTIIELRDTVKILGNIMGSVDPPIGVLGDIHVLKEEVRTHRDWLIGIKDRRQ